MPESAVITARVMNSLEAFSASKGVDFQRLAERCGIDPAVLGDPEGVIRFEAYADLLEHAASECGDDAFGLKFGMQFPRGPLGIYYYMIISSPTIRAALIHSVRFFRLVTTGYPVTFEEKNGVGLYEWRYPKHCDNIAQLSDSMLGILVDKIRQMSDDSWMPLKVEFAHPAPKARHTFFHLLGNAIEFNTPATRLSIDSNTLSRPSKYHDPYLIRELEGLAEKMLGIFPRSSGIVERTMDHIIRTLPEGEADEATVAASLAMSVRELQRELSAAGTTFTMVREEIRVETAKRLLEQSDLNLTEIAFLLGFSELSAFSRSAKSWFGVSPSAYRRQIRSDGDLLE